MKEKYNIIAAALLIAALYGGLSYLGFLPRIFIAFGLSIFLGVYAAAFTNLFLIAIQPTQIFEKYINFLTKLALHPQPFFNTYLYKWLGGCDICTCHFIACIVFIAASLYQAAHGFYFDFIYLYSIVPIAVILLQKNKS